jgi:predicted deacetylase
MKKYIIRLDDASEYMDVDKWSQIEELLDKHGVKPIFGIIPDNHDYSLTSIYKRDQSFWEKAHRWIIKGWIPAMHGCEHLYVTENGGVNPVNKRSEFAGLPYEVQEKKIERGWEILKEHHINPNIFFAPSHTFDNNTLHAIKKKTDIRIISDTIAYDAYKDGDFWFIPQQSGRVRKLPFKIVTFCYHPNMMQEIDYKVLNVFLEKHRLEFINYYPDILNERHPGLLDRIIRRVYFVKRRCDFCNKNKLM